MKILGKDYEVKYNLRSMFVFEEITGKAFNVETLLDEYIFLYSCIISVKENHPLDFEEFIDYCNDHQEVLVEFNEYMIEELKRKDMFASKKKVAEEETL